VACRARLARLVILGEGCPPLRNHPSLGPPVRFQDWIKLPEPTSPATELVLAPVILEPDEFGDWLDVSRDPAEIIAAARPERFAIS